MAPDEVSFVFKTSALRSICEGWIHLFINLRLYIFPPLAVTHSQQLFLTILPSLKPSGRSCLHVLTKGRAPP